MERGRARGPQHRTVQALATALRLDEPSLWEFLRTAKAGRARGGGRGRPDAGRRAQPRPEPPAGWGLRELPPEVADFTGREDELARLLALLGVAHQAERRAATVVVLFGAPGVGKTSFAVHAGHRLSTRYPDGALFLDLRGMETDRLSSGQALGRLLLALGVVPAEIPAGTEERSSLYRALLRDRRALVLLDNAANEAQVRPLLPSSPGCLLLVTSRRALAGLESVNRMLLDVLRPSAGVRLLASIIEPGRVANEPDAARQVTELCGQLPLALRIAGNRLASRPRWNIENLVHQLSDQRHRLTALTAGDLQVRTAFEVSYEQCDELTKGVFRRLGLVAGHDVTCDLAAVLADVDPATAQCSLEELVDASLLDAGAVEGRYGLHDLMRLFARERLAAEDTEARISAAEHRLTDWVLGTAVQAGELLSPPASDTARSDTASTGGFGSAAAAMDWLDTEQSHWLAGLHHAFRTGRHADVLAFSRAMHWYSDLRPTGDLWREVFTYGVRAARALGRRRDEAVQLNFLGWALNRIHGLHQEALRNHRQALLAAREAGDRNEEAWALQYCGRTELDRGKAAEAVEIFGPAIALFDELGDQFGQHVTLSFLGLALHKLGRYDEAATAQRAVVTFFRGDHAVSHRNILALALLRLADTLAACGDRAGAYATYQESGAVAVGAGSRIVEGLAWFGCGCCRQEAGDVHSGQQHLDIALEIFTDIGERWHTARVLHRLAQLLEPYEAGTARKHRRRALALCRQLNTPQSTELAAALTRALSASRDATSR